MIYESIYLAESHNFHNRRSLTGGRNSETITLPVKEWAKLLAVRRQNPQATLRSPEVMKVRLFKPYILK
ncbi:MAG: hypothetical protein LBG92_05625 [Prevotellaceae bacterium]|nr:hypothetical protein [Prevotellaceae bacterium]